MREGGLSGIYDHGSVPLPCSMLVEDETVGVVFLHNLGDAGGVECRRPEQLCPDSGGRLTFDLRGSARFLWPYLLRCGAGRPTVGVAREVLDIG